MAVFNEIKIVSPSVSSVVITHNLNTLSAVMTSAITGGWAGRPFISGRTVNNITLTFGVSAPAAGGTVDVEVKA